MKKILTFSVIVAALCGCFLMRVSACCSLAPASFRETRGLSSEALLNGKLVHVLAYQNKMVNIAAKQEAPWEGFWKQITSQPMGNAMLLPIPAVSGSMSKSNFVDTSSCPNFFEDIISSWHAAHPIVVWEVNTAGSARSGEKPQVFEHDIYTVVLATNAEDIPTVLNQIPLAKRPAINPEIFQSYAKWYKGWSFALCCFNNREEAEAKPLVWWYEPMHRDELFFPALDAHDGKVPKLNQGVPVDHLLFAASTKMDRSQIRLEPWEQESPDNSTLRAPFRVTYSSRKIDNQLRQLLPEAAMGLQFGGSLPQGDFVMQAADVRQGIMHPKRVLPPGALPPRKS